MVGAASVGSSLEIFGAQRPITGQVVFADASSRCAVPAQPTRLQMVVIRPNSDASTADQPSLAGPTANPRNGRPLKLCLNHSMKAGQCSPWPIPA